MEDEWEEEEQLVVVELSGMLNSDFLTKCPGKFKVLGIDTEQPMMQVGNYVFAGEYEDALGTCVIFEETHGADGGSESSPKLKYKCHTMKKLMLQRAFLSDRKEGESGSEGIEFLRLNDGEGRRRNDWVCNFSHDPAVVSCGEAGEKWRSESGACSPRSESDAECSDSERVKQTNEGATESAEVDLGLRTTIGQEAADDLSGGD